MAKELIVSVNGREKKIAIVENEKVTEFYIERGEGNQGIVGNIYKGRVMRVLPGMQSAFVDIGLERDAFLYVSDFFDEEEEFERIVIDKAKKGDIAEAQREASEQIEMGRVEREYRIEATQERAEPLREAPEIMDAPAESETPAEAADGGKRRSRRGRRRGRSAEFSEDTEDTSPQPRIKAGDIDTPFVASDPSIHRIVDEEESALVNGEMFKDARLQERLLDQIHAGEFNLEDDFRTAEVGSLLSSVDYRDESFQRIDDGESMAESAPSRTRELVAAHLETFIDEVDPHSSQSASFQRVSDDDETQSDAEPEIASEPVDEAKPRGRSAPRKSRLGKLLNSVSGKKKTATKRSSSKKSAKDRTADQGADAETSESQSSESYGDSEASVEDSPSRAEFATRRGGRRRRRPTKAETSEAAVDAPPSDSESEQDSAPEPAPIEKSAAPAPAAPTQRERGRNGRDKRGFSRRDRHQPTITELLREGQEVLVQIAKEPIAKKGARITSHIALPGRFLVYMPTVNHIGVSRKIPSDQERIRLKRVVSALHARENAQGGFIARTACAGISEQDLHDDMRYLIRTWTDVRKKADRTKPPTLVHRDLDLIQRILRDQVSDDFSVIRVDNELEYARIVEFVNRVQPRLVNRVKLYTGNQPIFEKYNVQPEIDKAVKPRVWLRSGGYIVINQTEALVAIDVNTGKFVGKSDRLEDTITKTNLEAAKEIVRQIRLRDLGGIIVIDFIDMEERKNRQRVLIALQQELQSDRAPSKILSINDFGLMAITRKRVKQSLERTLCTPCPYCQGAGMVKSAQTMCFEILEQAKAMSREMNGSEDVMLRVSPDVAEALHTNESAVLEEIEAYFGTPVTIEADPHLHQEQYDFAIV